MATKTYTTGTVIDSASMNDFDALSYQGNLPPTATGVPYARKNHCINGSMQVWQRGTSFAAAAVSSKTADRWFCNHGAGTINITRQQRAATDSCPTPFYKRIEKSAGVSGAFGTATMLERTSFDQFKGRAVVVSLYLRKGAALTADVSVQFFSSAAEGTFAANQLSSTLNVLNASMNTTTFTRFSQVVQIPTSTTDVGCGLSLFATMAGAANAYFEVAGVIIEMAPQADGGTFINVPSQYDLPPFAEELRACERYFQKSFPYAVTPAQNAGLAGSFGYTVPIAGAVQTISGTTNFPTRMRTTPTMTYFNPAAANAFARNFTRSTDSTGAVSSGALGDGSFAYAANVGAAGWVVGDLILIHYTADAEF